MNNYNQDLDVISYLRYHLYEVTQPWKLARNIYIYKENLNQAFGLTLSTPGLVELWMLTTLLFNLNMKLQFYAQKPSLASLVLLSFSLVGKRNMLAQLIICILVTSCASI